MAGAAELVEEGLRAYTRGDHREARRLWRRAVAVDPFDARAQEYLRLVEDVPEGSWLAPPARNPAHMAASAPAAPAARAGSRRAEEYAPSPWDDGPALAPTIVLEPEGGLDLSAVEAGPAPGSLVPEPAPAEATAHPGGDLEVWMQAARDLFGLGDFTGSLEMIEKILRVAPGHAEARRYLSENEATLTAMYESKLGEASSVPRLAIQPEEVLWLNLDHRAGFVLAQIDGTVSFDDLFALSGLPRLDTARILAGFLEDGVIRA